MNMLEVINAGLMVSVQAKARTGFLKCGVSPSGPMDEAAFQLAQALVGNSEDAAALEFAQFGGSYRVSEPCLIAVTGGAADIRINGLLIPAWESHILRPGETLSVGAMRGAVWGYIAFSGGIDVPLVLGSRTTHLRNAMGGFQGRALLKGDRLALGDGGDLSTRQLTEIFHRPLGPIRVIPGPQYDYFDSKTWSLFVEEAFTTTTERDRMASVLDGPFLSAFRGHDIVSDGTPLGSIQVPGSGNAVVLTSERQTTGGYPKIATIISADLPRLVQTPNRRSFHFTVIGQDEAEALLIAERRRIEHAVQSLNPSS